MEHEGEIIHEDFSNDIEEDSNIEESDDDDDMQDDDDYYTFCFTECVQYI